MPPAQRSSAANQVVHLHRTAWRCPAARWRELSSPRPANPITLPAVACRPGLHQRSRRRCPAPAGTRRHADRGGGAHCADLDSRFCHPAKRRSAQIPPCHAPAVLGGSAPWPQRSAICAGGKWRVRCRQWPHSRHRAAAARSSRGDAMLEWQMLCDFVPARRRPSSLEGRQQRCTLPALPPLFGGRVIESERGGSSAPRPAICGVRRAVCGVRPRGSRAGRGAGSVGPVGRSPIATGKNNGNSWRGCAPALRCATPDASP